MGPIRSRIRFLFQSIFARSMYNSVPVRLFCAAVLILAFVRHVRHRRNEPSLLHEQSEWTYTGRSIVPSLDENTCGRCRWKPRERSNSWWELTESTVFSHDFQDHSPWYTNRGPNQPSTSYRLAVDEAIRNIVKSSISSLSTEFSSWRYEINQVPALGEQFVVYLSSTKSLHLETRRLNFSSFAITQPPSAPSESNSLVARAFHSFAKAQADNTWCVCTQTVVEHRITIAIGVWNIMPRLESFVKMLENRGHSGLFTNFRLLLVNFDDESHQHIHAFLNNTITSFSWKIRTFKRAFSRSFAMNVAIEETPPDEIIFFCDPDMSLPPQLLHVIRVHTRKGESAFAPMYFYQSQPNTEIMIGAGVWAEFGFGLISVFCDDARHAGGFNRQFRHHAPEDKDFVERLLSAGLEIVRLKENGLVHLHHEKDFKNPWYQSAWSSGDWHTTNADFFLVWTTPAETFSARNHRCLESLFYFHPKDIVWVYSNTLPAGFFMEYSKRGFRILIKRFSLSDFVITDKLVGEQFVQSSHRFANSSHFYSHQTDFMRFSLLYRFGGSYVDFDHIFLRPIYLLDHAIGLEECRANNPFCFAHRQHPSGASAMFLLAPGVMLNFSPGLSIFLAALQEFDDRYDADCWGCMGPNLISRLHTEPQFHGQLHPLPPSAFYPFQWFTIQRAFVRWADSAAENATLHRIMTESYGFHLFGKMSGSLKPEEGSIAFTILARYRVLKGT